jgi:D-arabinose 1-dehydrogenase-like Zn-dependent alcohol dehydrogenase
MKAWRLGPSGFEPGEQKTRPLASDELRVQVEAVCLEPTDLAAAGDFAPGGGLVGRVIECGDAATAFDSARVLVSPVQACGECDSCRRSFATVCPSRVLLGRSADGGCAESIVANARWLTRLDQGLEVIEGPVAALIAGPALVAYALYCRAGVSAGELMIVLGQGATAAILSSLGESRGAKVIRASGSSAAVVRDALQDIDTKDQPQRIFVCDGEGSLALAMELAPPGSMIVAHQREGALELAPFVERELSLIGLSFGHPDLMPETAALVAKGELDLRPFMLAQTMEAASPESSRQAFEQGQCLVLSH